MPTEYRRAHCFLDRLLSAHTQDELRQRLRPKTDTPPSRVPRDPRLTADAADQRWRLLRTPPESRAALLDPATMEHMQRYEHNIENFIGSVKLPVGLAGPLRVNGLFAQGDYYIPLATTEATLVASYSRGAQLISDAGGCAAMLINEGMSRAPGFAFSTLEEAGVFVVWALSSLEAFTREAQATTRHGRLIDMRITIEGNHVYLNFEFTTGDAGGQNMVTLATEAICAYIRQHTPVPPQYSFLEANLSGDKKASAQSFLSVRGRKATAEVTVPAALVERRLHTTPMHMADYWRMSAIGGVLSGTLGVQGHYANGLAALYIACGQDPACVAESAVGVTRFEVTARDELYAAVTLPNLTVGTVGGGTGLPSQRGCLDVLGLHGTGQAAALAEVCAGLCLAGELSIIGALCAGEFAQAHRRLARGGKSQGVTRRTTDG
jgi:hydroxymethylglutaryl-CoA reductase (NADPH)